MTPALDPAQLLAETDWVRRLARRLVADPELAEDVAQETLLVAWRDGAGVKGSLRPWLAGVTRNLARTLGRNEGRRRAREEDAARSDEVSFEDALAKSEGHFLLAQAVNDLPEAQRAAVVWRYVEGLPYAEVAGRLGVTPIAARKRVSRALEQLRSELDRRSDRREWIGALAPLVALGTEETVKGKHWLAVIGALFAFLGGATWYQAAMPADVPAVQPDTPEVVLESNVLTPELERERVRPEPEKPQPAKVQEPVVPVVVGEDPAKGPSLFGKVIYTGRDSRRDRVVPDLYLGSFPGDRREVDVLDRELRVGENGGVRDVVVVVEDAGPATMGQPVIEMKNLRFEPHALVVHEKQRIWVANRDDLSIQLEIKGAREGHGATLLDHGQGHVLVYDRRGKSHEVVCADLPWARAWVHVIDDDEAGLITDEEGRFNFEHLDRGKYKVRVWLGNGKAQTFRVEIEDDEATELKLEYDGHRFEQGE